MYTFVGEAPGGTLVEKTHITYIVCIYIYVYAQARTRSGQTSFVYIETAYHQSGLFIYTYAQ